MHHLALAAAVQPGRKRRRDRPADRHHAVGEPDVERRDAVQDGQHQRQIDRDRDVGRRDKNVPPIGEPDRLRERQGLRGKQAVFGLRVTAEGVPDDQPGGDDQRRAQRRRLGQPRARHAQHAKPEQSDTPDRKSQRARARRRLVGAFRDLPQDTDEERRADRHIEQERSAPPAEIGESAGLQGSDDRRDDPGHIGHGDRVFAKLRPEQDADESHRPGENQAAADALKEPGHQQLHRLPRRSSSRARRARTRRRPSRRRPASADARPQRPIACRAHDRADQVKHHGPGVERHAADIGDDRRHQRVDQEVIDGEEQNADIQKQRVHAKPSSKHVGPGRHGRFTLGGFHSSVDGEKGCV